MTILISNNIQYTIIYIGHYILLDWLLEEH